ncbi:hypothetical protein LPTSP4_01730 [Leptospira ryugenii]|uniref:Uncharacterized protein n=1 Tax=Leptospira ryugenii TaxID=1917863 RepID=A0A2P2DVL9_9LEPT|nr:DUF1826 domain-containing protein [Leptospira ryugenii]GBF48673.1 hypothetical protein LPTSP4_01730 [Leptospira ryugenii]
MKTLSTPGHFVESTSAGVLHLIQERGVNLCIWQRDENPLLLSYVDFLLKKKSFSLELNSQNRSEWRSLLPEDTDIESVQAFSEELETLADLFEAISSQVIYRIHLINNETDPGNGLVHKSPEIKGKKRFVLRIDAHSRL